MFQEREIVLAFINDIQPPKRKFLITLYRDQELNIVACFTTSQQRLPAKPEDVQHGVFRKNGAPMAYVFEKGRTIGTDPKTNTPFSFHKRTIVYFDYCFQAGTLDKFEQRTNSQDRETVCIMNDKEFVDLIYAMYRSPYTNGKFLPLLEKSLEKYSNSH